METIIIDIVVLENYLMWNKNLEFQAMEVVCMEAIVGCMVVDLGVSITSIVASSSEPATVNQINWKTFYPLTGKVPDRNFISGINMLVFWFQLLCFNS